MSLDDIADRLEREWYSAPRLVDWKRDPRNPKASRTDTEPEE